MIVALEDICVTLLEGESQKDILKGVSLNVSAGSLVSIVGASGSGKSTLINVIGLLLKPSSGRYTLNGSEINLLSDTDTARQRNKYIGFVFQNYHLLPRLNVLQNVCMPLIYNRNTKLSRSEIRTLGQEKLRAVGLGPDYLKRQPQTLSGGEQQRTAIARALINDPEIILADEPTGALDSKNAAHIVEMLTRLSSEKEKTVIMITHDQAIARHCDIQYEIADGLLGQ